MMSISGRDSLCIAAVAVLIGVLTLGTGKGKGKPVPVDDRHRPIYDALQGGRSRLDTELLCSSCHSKNSLPLPKDHPPKEQCLICHLPVSGKR